MGISGTLKLSVLQNFAQTRNLRNPTVLATALHHPPHFQESIRECTLQPKTFYSVTILPQCSPSAMDVSALIHAVKDCLYGLHASCDCCSAKSHAPAV